MSTHVALGKLLNLFQSRFPHFKTTKTVRDNHMIKWESYVKCIAQFLAWYAQKANGLKIIYTSVALSKQFHTIPDGLSKSSVKELIDQLTNNAFFLEKSEINKSTDFHMYYQHHKDCEWS